MDKPDNPEAFVCFQDEDIQIYLARDIWEQLAPGTEKLLVAIQDWGRFWLWLGDAWMKHQGEMQ